MMACSPSSSGDSFIASFLTAVKADLDSPVTSNFGNRICDYRLQTLRIAEEIDADTVYFDRMRRISKDIESVLLSFAKQLLVLGVAAKELAEKWAARGAEAESDGAAALLKMELFLRAEAELVNDQARNWNNNMVHPLDLLVAAPSEIRNKSVDKACRDYEVKFVKAESEAKKHAKQSGYSRSQISHGELAEELSNERLLVEYELCKFLLGLGAVEDKKSAQLVRHFLELFRSQHECCLERLKMNDHFRCDFETLEKRMSTRSANCCQQRNSLFDLKTRLEGVHGALRPATSRRGRTESYGRGSRLSIVDMYGGTSSSSVGLGSTTGADDTASESSAGLHVSNDSCLLVGFLYKKSNKKLHKQWQKRRCRIQDGCFWLSHSDESLPPAKLSLLVSDCKPSSEGPRMFDLYCRDRTYHLQAENEADAKRWVIALKQEILRLKTELLNAESAHEETTVSGVVTREWREWKKCVSSVRNLPGNHECADCSSTDDVQWLSNTGALVCIACSGVHRELGVHVSRIQSLDLDVISPLEFLIPLTTGNNVINRIYEYDERACNLWKPRSGCNRSDRQNFIQMKYRDRAFIHKVEDADLLFIEALRELGVEKAYKALLSPAITSSPFVEHGAFIEMIQQNNPLALPIIQLVVQLGINLPALESMLTECVQSGNSDALSVLLHNHSSNNRIDTVSLKPLENLALKLGYAEVAEVLRVAQSSSRGQLSQITIPASLIISTSSSGSLSHSSSSVSPLARPSPEVNLDSSSSPVNVLMRNGTTISVPRDNNNLQKTQPHFPSSPASDRRSTSPIESRSRPCSVQVYACSTFPLSTSASSFKGTTFGKCLNEVTQQRAAPPSNIEQQVPKQVSAAPPPDTSHAQISIPASAALNASTGGTYLNLSSSSSSGYSPKVMPTNEEVSAKVVPAGVLATSVPQQTNANVSRSPTHVPATPNYYTKAPGPLNLNPASGKPNSSNSVVVDKDPPSASSVPSSPVPALPTQPKPKMYHRSASEYNQAVPNVGALRELHEQKVSSISLKKTAPPNSHNERFLKPANGMSTSFSMASSSVSLDPIPLVQSVRKDEKCSSVSMREKSVSTFNSSKAEGIPVKRRTEKSEPEPAGNVAAAEGEKKRVFTAFDAARASFMTPGERARFSSVNPVGRGDSMALPDLKKAMSSDGAPAEHAPVFPKGVKNMVSSAAVKLKPPVPTPRRSMGTAELPQREYVRRCRALYDCAADNPDELSFKQGDLIIISKERIAGENDTWMEGYLASDPQRKGVFPITFVTFQS